MDAAHVLASVFFVSDKLGTSACVCVWVALGSRVDVLKMEYKLNDVRDTEHQ